MEVVLASSSVDSDIGSWDLHTGAEQLRFKSCASQPHGLVSLGQFFASSQITKSSASVLYWSFSKPQVEVKSFPAETIKPLASNREGTYIVGGGVSGDIYLWEVVSGRLLKKWHAHYRAVTCLVFTDNSLLISGSEDGSVKVWSLLMVFDDYLREQASHPYVHNLAEHTLCITDIAVGFGDNNAVIVSASEDRTCKVWCLSTGKLLRNIVFPSIIGSIALDPEERVFYAGSRDGKIYVAALHTESPSSKNWGRHIISAFSNHSKAVTCLKHVTSRNYLISGSEDGMVRVWNAKTHDVIRVFKHGKGPVNNIIVVKKQLHSHVSSKRQKSSIPPLEKFGNSTDEDIDTKTVICNVNGAGKKSLDSVYVSSIVAANQFKELEQQGSAGSNKLEMEKLKVELGKSMQMVQQWKQMYENLHQFCVDELLEDCPVKKCRSLENFAD